MYHQYVEYISHVFYIHKILYFKIKICIYRIYIKRIYVVVGWFHHRVQAHAQLGLAGIFALLGL